MTDARLDALDRRSILRGSVTLAGAAVVLPSFAALGGCSSAPVSLEGHLELIAAIAGRIIPPTDTPGAVEAGVPAYIGAIFGKHFTAEQRQEFLDGLDAIVASAKADGVGDFASAPEARQDVVLKKLVAAPDAAPGKATWQNLHDMTVFGFYTAEVATEELAYEELPGRHIGCLPYEEIGRAWLDRGV